MCVYACMNVYVCTYACYCYYYYYDYKLHATTTTTTTSYYYYYLFLLLWRLSLLQAKQSDMAADAFGKIITNLSHSEKRLFESCPFASKSCAS